MDVAAKLVDELVDYGVKHVFGVPGGQTLPLYDAIEEHPGEITHVLVRDERSGVYAADGYARASGRIGVCDATVGPGASNLVSGLVEAHSSSIPVLAIIADLPREWEHRRRLGSASQGFDQRGFLEACVRWYGRVETPENLTNILHSCMRMATSGRPGPVVLEIPDDVFTAETPDADGPASPRWAEYPRLRSAPDEGEIRNAVDRLTDSDRPMILAGGGALQANAENEVRRLAETLECPVATSLTGKGIVPETHPLSVGVSGSFGLPIANQLLLESDCVVFIGCKTGQSATLSWTAPPLDTPIIHIDVDPTEIGRNYRDTIGVWADALHGTGVLADELGGQATGTAWDFEQIEQARTEWWEGPVDYDAPPEPGVIKPQALVRTMRDVMSDRDLLISDASLASGWIGSQWRATSAGKYCFAPRGLAGLGWGLPAMIGVQNAVDTDADSGRVVGLAGDGGWGYSMAEVETAARQELPLVSVILNNSSLGWIRHSAESQDLDVTTATDFSAVSYGKSAEALGANAEIVDSIDDFETTFETALSDASNRPWVIETITCAVESPIRSPDDERETGY
jgi:acetolactate synthase-1/2/3 large subunit